MRQNDDKTLRRTHSRRRYRGISRAPAFTAAGRRCHRPPRGMRPVPDADHRIPAEPGVFQRSRRIFPLTPPRKPPGLSCLPLRNYRESPKLARRFRALREEPNASYDAVVIGAGVGGLICANLLARAGLSVLIVEQHFMVGGYCSTFRRKGFTFDAATHFYPLLGNPATITGALLAELEITTEWVKMDPVDCFHFPDRTSFHVPASFDAYLQQLKHEFPEESQSIDRFFALVRNTYMIGLVHYFRNVSTPRIAAYQRLTIQEVLNQYFTNQKLKLLLAGDIG